MDTIIPRLRRFLSWHRRAVAAALTGLAVFALAQQVTPHTHDEVPVVILAADLPPGAVLSEANLEVIRVPAATVPAQHYSHPSDVAGQSLGFGLSAGTIVQAGMLAATPVLAEGRVLVPIQIRDDSLRQMLAAGTRVTLVLAETSEVVCSDARVVTTPTHQNGSVFSPTGGSKPLLLVDVPTDIGPSISALGQTGQLSVILATTN